MFDIFTLSIATATVVVVTGITFIINALLWRDDPAGRVWSLAFTAGVASVVAEVVGLLGGPSWITILSDGLFVSSWWLIWSGLRVYNLKSAAYPISAFAALAGITVSALQPLYSGISQEISYLPLLSMASILAALEANGAQLRGRQYARPFMWASFVFGTYVLSRFVFAIALPADHPVNVTLFSDAAMLLVVIAMVVFSALSATMLRAERLASQVLQPTATELGIRVLPVSAFYSTIDALRAHSNDDSGVRYLVAALQLDDQDDLRDALGRDEFDRNQLRWRERVTQLFGPMAIVADLSPSIIGVLVPVLHQRDAEQRLHSVMNEATTANGFSPGGVTVTMSVGAVLLEHDAAAQPVNAAMAAAARASAAGGHRLEADW